MLELADLIEDTEAEKNINITKPNKTQPISIQSKRAFAQLDLLGFSALLKAQTKSIIKPTNGMLAISKVQTHSLIFTGADGEIVVELFALFSMFSFSILFY